MARPKKKEPQTERERLQAENIRLRAENALQKKPSRPRAFATCPNSASGKQIIGQCVGAGRRRLTRELGYLCVSLGIAVMAVMGVVMWVFAPEMIGMMSPDDGSRAMGADILRIKSFAEPIFAAAIVSYGVFVGAGDTLVPSCMNFGSIWLVRLSLAALLAPSMGLHVVWIAMCVELCIRGLLFLIRLRWGNWLHLTRG